MFSLKPGPAPARCGRCQTQLSALAIVCPSCSALVHRDRLEALARDARYAEAASDLSKASGMWSEALLLVPKGSEQHRVIDARLSALRSAPAPEAVESPGHSGRGKVVGVAITVGALVLGKLKFLLLGLTKVSTLMSMFAFIGVYWSIHGWPLALGLAGSIYIHEMGHVAMLRRLHINASAPLFIPGVGALVMLKEHVTDPVVDARIGLAGPLWGLGAALSALALYGASGTPIWLAIGELTAFLNLFNLIPIWQLDGSRGFHALSRAERWTVTGAAGLMLMVTQVPILWFVTGVGVYRSVWSEPGPGHRPTLTTFVVLVLALALIARSVAA